MAGTEGNWDLMERYDLAGWVKLYNRLYLIKNAGDWSRELDFEQRQRTNPKRRWYIGRDNFMVFALFEQNCSKFYADVPESRSQYWALWALGFPNPVVYSYFTDVYHNGSAALLLVGRIAKAKTGVLSLGAFLQAAQYGSASRFAHSQMQSSCEGRDALLRESCVLVLQWCRYEIFDFLKNMYVNLECTLFAIACAAEAVRDAELNMDWFPYTFGEWMISVLLSLVQLRQVSASGEQIEKAGIITRKPEYLGDFACRRMLETYARKAWKRFADIGNDLTDPQILPEQEALIA